MRVRALPELQGSVLALQKSAPLLPLIHELASLRTHLRYRVEQTGYGFEEASQDEQEKSGTQDQCDRVGQCHRPDKYKSHPGGWLEQQWAALGCPSRELLLSYFSSVGLRSFRDILPQTFLSKVFEKLLAGAVEPPPGRLQSFPGSVILLSG